jgi:hypothetical protein
MEGYKKYKHLPHGKIHIFETSDETVTLCGRDDLTPGEEWVDVDITQIVPTSFLDQYKCKTCLSLLIDPHRKYPRAAIQPLPPTSPS